MKKFKIELSKRNALGLDWYFSPVAGDKAIDFIEKLKEIESSESEAEKLKIKIDLILKFLKEIKDNEGLVEIPTAEVMYNEVSSLAINNLFDFLKPRSHAVLMREYGHLLTPIIQEKVNAMNLF